MLLYISATTSDSFDIIWSGNHFTWLSSRSTASIHLINCIFLQVPDVWWYFYLLAVVHFIILVPSNIKVAYLFKMNFIHKSSHWKWIVDTVQQRFNFSFRFRIVLDHSSLKTVYFQGLICDFLPTRFCSGYFVRVTVRVF